MVAVCQSQFLPPGCRGASDLTITRLTSASCAAWRMTPSGNEPLPAAGVDEVKGVVFDAASEDHGLAFDAFQ